MTRTNTKPLSIRIPDRTLERVEHYRRRMSEQAGGAHVTTTLAVLDLLAAGLAAVPPIAAGAQEEQS